jgi:hypothetical protein
LATGKSGQLLKLPTTWPPVKAQWWEHERFHSNPQISPISQIPEGRCRSLLTLAPVEFGLIDAKSNYIDPGVREA